MRARGKRVAGNCEMDGDSLAGIETATERIHVHPGAVGGGGPIERGAATVVELNRDACWFKRTTKTAGKKIRGRRREVESARRRLDPNVLRH